VSLDKPWEDHPRRGRLLPALYWVLGVLASLVLFAMMALTFVDVVGRYFFNTPAPGGFEVTEVMMAVLIFAGLPLVTARGEMVTVDLFDKVIPAAVRHVRDGIVSLLCAAMLFVLAWSLKDKGIEAAEYGDVTMVLGLPLAPVIYFMGAMMAATGVVFVAIAIRQFRGEKPAGSGDAAQPPAE